MNPATTQDERVLDHLLESLLDLPDEERSKRLQRLRDTRPALAERLARLLAFAADENAFAPAGALMGELAIELLDSEAPPLSPGTVFCGYRIEAAIGRGGMSDVYRASRDYGDFQATVALKLIHRGKGHSSLRRFLEHERRALVRLEHPGIARFIDAGESPDGDLYLAMEYVAGEPILDYADRQTLPLRRRVDLLVELCRALEHAHARRLIHGDVKSQNVLVDESGRLRLVDFGIASTPDGGNGRRAFTPGCAAPEQLAGRELTLATDVFQIGALAYRLLSGCLYRSDAEKPNAAALPPGRAIAAGDKAAMRQAAQARGLASPRALSRALKGDLDAIVLHCLADDPEQRYPSCAALREDLLAWRRLRPVRARKGGTWLALGKFLRRHALSSLLIVIALTALVASTTVFLYRLRQTELTRLAEAERAVRVEHFLAELFRTGSPYLRQDGRDPLATFAGLGATLLDESPDLDRRTRARIGLSLAQLQLARGDGEQARQLLDDAIEAFGDSHGASPVLGAELLEMRARLLRDSGGIEDAVAIQSDANRWLRQGLAPPVRIALGQATLADMLRRLGRSDEAQPLFAAAIPSILETFDSPTLETIRTLDYYAAYLAERNDLDALRALRPTLADRLQSVEARTLADAELSSVLARIESLLDGPIAAATRYEQTAERFVALLGDSHPRVARALTDACVSNMEYGRMREAHGLCERAMTLYYQTLGPDSEGVAVTTMNLSVIAYNTGALDEADTYGQRAQRLIESSDRPFMAQFGRLMQGRIAAARGRYAQALAHMDRAEAIRAANFADNPSLRLEIAEQRAFVLVGLGRLDEAEQTLEESMPSLDDLIPADRQRNLVWADVVRAQLAGARRDWAGVATAATAALERYPRTPGRNDTEEGWIYSELALATHRGGDPRRARALFDQALAFMSPEANGVYWATAWAGARLSGRSGDAALDARARRLLQDNGVETEIARTYLALR